MLWIWTVVMLPPLTHHAVGGLRIPVPEGWRLESVEGARAMFRSEDGYIQMAVIPLEEWESVFRSDPGQVDHVAREMAEQTWSQMDYAREGAKAGDALAEVWGDGFRLIVQVRPDPPAVAVLLLGTEARLREEGGPALARAIAANLRRADGSPEPSGTAEGQRPSGGGGVHGTWEYVGVGAMLDYFDAGGRWLRTDWHGSGWRVTLQEDGRYEWVYRAQVTSGVMVSATSVVETGRWEQRGRRLILKPSSQKGWIYVGSPSYKESVREDLTPRVYGVQERKGDMLILKGPCAPFQVDTWCEEGREVAITYRRLP